MDAKSVAACIIENCLVRTGQHDDNTCVVVDVILESGGEDVSNKTFLKQPSLASSDKENGENRI